METENKSNQNDILIVDYHFLKVSKTLQGKTRMDFSAKKVSAEEMDRIDAHNNSITNKTFTLNFLGQDLGSQGEYKNVNAGNVASWFLTENVNFTPKQLTALRAQTHRIVLLDYVVNQETGEVSSYKRFGRPAQNEDEIQFSAQKGKTVVAKKAVAEKPVVTDDMPF
jgi:hypothetical protein